MKRTHSISGFSLAETTIALAVMAICITSLVGPISVALNAIGDGNRQGEAARLCEYLDGCIRGSALVAGTANVYAILGDPAISDKLRWSVGGAPVVLNSGTISSPGGRAFACAIELYPPGNFIAPAAQPSATPPPGNLMSPGRAVVRLAWPAERATYTAATGWSNAQGKWETILYFRAP